MDDKMNEEMEWATNESSLTHLNEEIDMSDTDHKPKTGILLLQR
jgi:hypothetical protein